MIGTWAPSFYTMENTLPLSAHLETNDLICFVLFWTLSLPILAIRPERYRIPAVLSSVAVTVGVLALMIWALAKQGGGGPLLLDVSKTLGKPRLKGAALGWAMVKSVSSGIGGWAGCVALALCAALLAPH
jgi:NCS1 family nucleobase:cation symporter-1